MDGPSSAFQTSTTDTRGFFDSCRSLKTVSLIHHGRLVAAVEPHARVSPAERVFVQSVSDRERLALQTLLGVERGEKFQNIFNLA